MGDDRVGEARRIVEEPGDRRQDLGRYLPVDLDVLLELRDERAAEGLDLASARGLRPEQVHFRLEVGLGLEIAGHPGPLDPFHQHLDRVVGKPQELQDVGDPSDLVEAVDGGILLGLVLLGDEHDPLVGLHREIEGANRLLAAHEEGDDDVGEHHHVAQREDRQNQPFARGGTVVRHSRFLHQRQGPGPRPASTPTRPASRRPRRS